MIEISKRCVPKNGKQETEDIVAWSNEIIKNEMVKPGQFFYGEDHCVLIDVAAGNFVEEICNLYKHPKGGYHLLINGQYQDPDITSHILYIITAIKFNKRLEKEKYQKIKNKIKKFEVASRGNYKFCLSAKDNQENPIMELGADWAFNWNLIARCDKQQQWEITKAVQTIKSHPLWPCRCVEGNSTVNQVRSDKISMYNTLKTLQYCYEKWNNKEKIDYNNGYYSSMLMRAFDNNQAWYLLFGTFNTYVDFWDLKMFKDEEINEKNIYNKFCNQLF